MTREELIKQCRYYRGEKECPNDNYYYNRFWGYEKVWVDEMTEYKRTGVLSSLLMCSMHEYQPFADEGFAKDDGVNIYLKAILCNRYEHWNESVSGFKKWYTIRYINKDFTTNLF